MPIQPTDFVWMNGRFVKWNEANVHVGIHALHYGTGVFEGIRCYQTQRGPAVFRLRSHMERFARSAKSYLMDLPYSVEQLEAAVLELIQRNRLQHCYIRPLAYYGLGGMNLFPRESPLEVFIMVWPWGAYLGADNLEKGVQVTFSPWVKFHSTMFPPTAKGTGQYLNSILAVREAMSRGFDEAILLDVSGNISEGSGENLFIVRKGCLITNGAESDILMGVTRDSVLTIARDRGMETCVRPIRPEELLSAEEAFFTGTAAEVTPIRQVDDHVIASGGRGLLTTALQETFFAAVDGRVEKYLDWLSFV